MGMTSVPRHETPGNRRTTAGPAKMQPGVVDPFGARNAAGRSSHPPGVSWASWYEFRAEDARRIGPCEVEFGSQWQGGVDPLPWRVVWLEGTGEVIAIQWSAEGEDGAAGPVELLAVGLQRGAIDRALKDWWHMCGHVGSLDWVRRRLVTSLPDHPSRR
jgi:hypothetical protein